MIHLPPRERICLDKSVELLPREGFALTASIEPLEQYACGELYELLHQVKIEGHAVVADMSLQLGTEETPEDR